MTPRLRSPGLYALTWILGSVVCAASGLVATLVEAGEIIAIGPSVNVTVTDGDETVGHVAAQPGGDFTAVFECRGGHCAESGTHEIVDGVRFDAGGARRNGRRNLSTTDREEQLEPAICADGAGNVVVALTCWGCVDRTTDSATLIRARRFDPTGSPLGPEFVVNNYQTGYQRNPDVGCASDGSFVVVWAGEPDLPGALGPADTSRAIFARAYDPSGAARGTEFQINTQTGGSQRGPAVAVSEDASFAVVWHAILDEASGWDTFARVFAGDGTPSGEQFRVNSYTTGTQMRPALAAGVDGTFVVTWNEHDEGRGSNVVARRIGPNGPETEPELRVNDSSNEPQFAPGIAALPAGEFVVAWGAGGAYSTYDRIFVRLLDVDAVPTGAQVEVGADASIDFSYGVPDVSASQDGRFVVVWTGYDIESHGILASRFSTTEIGPVCGDANDDTFIRSGDALHTLAAVVGLASCEPASCDVDDSGIVSVADALRLLRFVIFDDVAIDCP